MYVIWNYIRKCGAAVAQRVCNGLPRNDPGFDFPLGTVKKKRASRPSQETVNWVPSLDDLAVDGTFNTTNQLTYETPANC